MPEKIRATEGRLSEITLAVHAYLSAEMSKLDNGTIVLGRRRYRNQSDFDETWLQPVPGGRRNQYTIKGWELYWESAQDARGGRDEGIAIGRLRRTHTYHLLGFMSYEESTEQEMRFYDFTEAMADAITGHVQVDGVRGQRLPASSIGLEGEDIRYIPQNVILMPASVDTDMAEFGDALCFVADITFEVTEDLILGRQ